MPRPPAPVTRRELRSADMAAHRRHRGAVPLVAVAVTAALLGGGSAQAYTDRIARARHEVIAAASAHERATLVRAQRADVARLNAEAVRYAGTRRSEALTAAQVAVAAAQTVTAIAVADVAPDVLAPLGSATADLTALIVSVSVSVPAAVPWAVPAAEPEAAGIPTSADVPAAAAPVASTDGGTPAIDPPAAALSESLAVSARMLAAAQVVTDLSAQVRAAVGANAAQVAAEAAAEVAAQASADDLALRVAAAKASANGTLPLANLCGLSFAPQGLLRCDAAAALEQLGVAFRAEFHRDLVVSSAYRTFDEQVAVKAARGGLAATAGSSRHGLGIAVDFAGFGTVGAFGEPTYLWMKENAEQLGWSHPALMEVGGAGPQEPWHWEFAPVAPDVLRS